MPIIRRQDKVTPLTFEEMDGNFTFLDESITDLRNDLSTGLGIPDEYVRSLFQAGNAIIYDNRTGVISVNSSQVVKSINGVSGELTITADSIPEGIGNLYYTEERVSTQVKNSISVGSGLTKIDTATGVSISPRNFNIRLTGAVLGNATVNSLGDVIINTSAGTGFTTSSSGEVVSGITGVLIRSPDQLSETEFRGIEFSSNDFNVVAEDTYVSISSKLTNTDIINTVGQVISGTIFNESLSVPTESGIVVTFDDENNAIRVAPRDFTITINGAVSGSATVSRLQNTTITVNNSNNYIAGIDTQLGGVKRNTNPITALNFSANDFVLSAINNVATISVKDPITEQDVRDIIGETVVGTERQVDLVTPTETGIIVNYDRDNNVLEVAPRDFTITLSGDISGSGTVSRLRDITIPTTTTAIKGLNVNYNTSPFATLIKTLDFSNNFTLTKSGDRVIVDIESVIDTTTIRDALATAFTGAQDGISVAYNSIEEQFSFGLSDLSISLAGAVTGNATLAYNGNGTQTLSIITEIGEIGSGLEVRDEGTTKGESIAAINFVGAGVTSSVTVDGQVATVNIPNSPAAEKFILIDNGSANVPNARRLTAGTGIILNDAGAGGDITISASGGDVLGKIQVEANGELIAEEPTINVVNSQQVFVTATHDGSTNTINIIAYSKEDGWWRQSAMDHGDITDKYGNSLDMGNISVGIIEHQIDFGEFA